MRWHARFIEVERKVCRCTAVHADESGVCTDMCAPVSTDECCLVLLDVMMLSCLCVFVAAAVCTAACTAVYCLVLQDIMMPGMSGFEVCLRLREGIRCV